MSLRWLATERRTYSDWVVEQLVEQPDGRGRIIDQSSQPCAPWQPRSRPFRHQSPDMIVGMIDPGVQVAHRDVEVGVDEGSDREFGGEP